MENEVNRAAILGDRPRNRRIRGSSRPGSAIRTDWIGSRKPARCGPSSTSAMRSATISFPTIMTSVQDGAFYGWPYSYYGQHVDARVKPQHPDLVATCGHARLRARRAHRFARAGVLPGCACCRSALPAAACSLASTGHGIASRASGYKVIFVPFADGHPVGVPEEVLTGFVDAQGNAMGRPVGVAVDQTRRAARGGRCWQCYLARVTCRSPAVNGPARSPSERKLNS